MEYAKKFNTADKALLRAAYELGEKAHSGQMRKTGQPFFTHPLTIACMMISYQPEVEIMAATLLHDTIEDTSVTMHDIAAISPSIADIVE
jgi:GTP diphosphokinase / guanosine-3',5'-bis(diphosphate) 3'-diphosphatase